MHNRYLKTFHLLDGAWSALFDFLHTHAFARQFLPRLASDSFSIAEQTEYFNPLHRIGSRLAHKAKAPPRTIKVWTVVFLFLWPQPYIRAQEITLSGAGKIWIKAVRITGNHSIGAEELELIVKSYVGKELDLAELKSIADLITEEYQRKGYTLARAYIPAQEIKDGIVEIAVLEGRVGEIAVRGNKHYSTDFIKSGFAPVLQEGIIRQSALEKALLLLNENTDLKAKAVLQAGEEPGTTDIVVHVEDRLPLHLALDYNNFGSTFVSRNRFGAELTLSKFLFIEGSSLSVRGVMGSDPSDLLYGRTSYSLPINNHGTKLGFAAFGGDFDVGREFAELNIKGKIWGYTFSFSHPFSKTRFHSLTSELGFESKDTKEFFLDSLSSRDRIRMLKAGVNYELTDSTGRNFISFYLFQGLGAALGAMENNDPKSSRVGADNRFTRLNLHLARAHRLNDLFSLILRGSGQVSTDSLVASEQFSLGGADTVRGYPQGEFLGDDAYNVGAELRISPLANREIAQLAFFIDHGAVSVKRPASGQKKYRDLTGAGLGLRLSLPYDLHARFDIGFPVKPAKASSGGRPTYYVQGVARF
jgi:hemolysin activation/secretion protein